MKTIKNFFPGLMMMIAFTMINCGVKAQDKESDKEVATRNLLDSQRYVFHAEYVLPSSGRQRYLSTDYTVRVSKDSIICDLPYIGRAYTAPINPSEGGIKFTSTDFELLSKEGKKGRRDITIKTKDQTDTQQLFMTVFTNGTASLQVTSNNRQPISFNGYISEKNTR